MRYPKITVEWRQLALWGAHDEPVEPASEPRFDTADFSDTSPGNLRVDYVLPSADLTVCASGVVWPTEETGPAMSSDHRLVWIDVALPGQGCPSVSSKP